MICPLCHRVPGNPHDHLCPRSSDAQLRLAQECQAMLQPRVVWSFGPQVVTIPGRGQTITNNPGVPYVRMEEPDPDNPGEMRPNGRSWNLGGVPSDLQARNDRFMQTMKKRQSYLRAIKEKIDAPEGSPASPEPGGEPAGG